jgi:DNA-binding response OmpR family regulator
MLPTRAYTTHVPPLSPGGTRPAASPAAEQDTRPTLLVAASPTEAERISASTFTRMTAHSTADVVRAIERARPRVVAIDWDAEGIDGAAVCAAAKLVPFTGILVVSGAPERVPPALKAGCHAVLLRPFVPNLLAARLGRLSREIPTSPGALRGMAALQLVGTNRVWADTHCPGCRQSGAVSFEFSSYRRMWYACLACEHVWLGPRQE